MASGGSGQLNSGATARSAGRCSWRPAGPQEAPRHQWQRVGRGTGPGMFTGQGRRRTRIGLFLTLAAALLAFLVWELLYAPVQTPVLIVAPTEYEWPLIPNSWAAEDIAALGDLHHKTLDLVDVSSEWRSAERGLARFDESLKKIARASHRSRAAIFYFSMHGGIDGQARPCFIPPGAQAHDSGTWLQVATILEHIEKAELPAGTHKLLIVDCSKQPISWNVGQIAGGFVDAIADLANESPIPNLAVLSAADGSHVAATSSSLRGSVFGHYLRLGLAGAADERSASGNGNGRVTLRELKNYLSRHVNAWVAHHHGRAQTPETFPPAADFDVAWSLRGAIWRNLVSRAQRIEPAEPTLPRARMVALWQSVDALRAARPWRYDPVGWRQLEQRLLWLEQLSGGGKAYEQRAAALAAELSNELHEAEKHLAAARGSRSLPAYASLLNGQTVLPSGKMHSLPMTEFWGAVERDAVRTLRSQLDQCQREPSAENIRASLLAANPSLPLAMDESNFLAICERLHVPSLWGSPAPLSQLLRVRASAEQLATPPADGELPGDERAHAWVRGPLDSLDRARRELEDATFLGPQRGDQFPAGAELAAALESFSLGQRSAKVLALRDQLWAEFPYLAQWLCRAQPDAAHQSQADAAIRQVLLPLVTAGLDLERRLTRNDSDGAVWSADSAAIVVQEKTAVLQATLQSTIDAALAATNSADAIREIEALLQLPVLAWDTREQLVRQRLDLHLKLAARYDGPFDGAPQLEAKSAAGAPYAARAASWPSHPLAMILNAERNRTFDAAGSGNRNPLHTCAALGEQVRQNLAALASAPLAGSGAQTSAAREASTVRQVGDGLAALVASESEYRRVASLWYPPPSVDPVRELRRWDLQALFLWRAGRALEDFYGPQKLGQEPFFSTSVGDYLGLARALGPMSQNLANHGDALDRLLGARRIAAREALTTRATDILLVEQAASVNSEVVVAPRTPESLADLPQATAATFLADSAGRVGRRAWALKVPVSNAAADQPLLREELLLPSEPLKSRGPLLQAVASVRGNDFVAPVLLRAPGGARVEFTRQEYGPPQVTVLGHEQKRASVVFVLDCSHSMQEAATIESPDGSDRAQSTRMEVAKRALNMLLAELSQRGTMRVGVRLFGHRVGWSTTEAGKLLRQTAYSDEIPAELRPYADVEQILPLGRFDSIAAGRVFDRLQRVKAWGESPIYLALQQAIGEFGAADESARSIVIITDGNNYQFNAPREFQPALNDVIAAAERAQIAVQIVGFELPEAEARAASSEFNRIASRTGGSYVPVSGATALLESLQRLLQPAEFRVADAAGALVERASLGTPVTLPSVRGRQSYTVNYESSREPVELVGGEAVELVARRGEQRLEVIPYLKGSPRFEPVVQSQSGQATQLQIGVHRSLRTPDSVQFPISLQHVDGHYVPRPAEIWVEVLPLGLPPDASNGPYLFYDAPFSAGTTVPLANLVARDWPQQVRKAEIRVWSKASASAPTTERPLTDVADRPPEVSAGFAIPGTAGVGYQVRTAGGDGQPLVVGVVERHERGETVGSLKLALSPPPRGATHQFDPQNRVVLHTFVYDLASADRSRVRLQFTTRDSALANTVRSSQPVIIDVSDRTDLLELTPALAK